MNRWTLLLLLIAAGIGGAVRLAVTSGDIASLASYLAPVVVTGVPAIQAAWRVRRVHEKVDEVDGKADAAVHAAQQAEHNTNGKLTAEFVKVHREINGVRSLVAQHMSDGSAHYGRET